MSDKKRPKTSARTPSKTAEQSGLQSPPAGDPRHPGPLCNYDLLEGEGRPERRPRSLKEIRQDVIARGEGWPKVHDSDLIVPGRDGVIPLKTPSALRAWL